MTPQRSVQVISIAQAGIARGQRAWGRLKATAEEQRTLWLEVGVALMYGKQKGNRKPGQKFSEWVQEGFPGLREQTASDAMWWAMNSTSLGEIPADITHPEWVRRWANQQAAQALPEDLQEIAPEPAIVLPQRDAERVAKTLLRAESNDQGADIAKRHVEALAKKHGTTVEQLTEAAKVGAPDTYFRLAPTVQIQLDEFRENLRTSIVEMEESGITKDAIKAIFIHFANSL